MRHLIEQQEQILEGASGKPVKGAYDKWRKAILALSDRMERVVSAHYDGRHKVRSSLHPSQDTGTPEILDCQIVVEKPYERGADDTVLAKKLKEISGMDGWGFNSIGGKTAIEASDIPK